MKKLIKKIAINFTLIASLLMPSLLAVPAAHAAQTSGNIYENVCEGVSRTSDQDGCDESTSGGSFADLAKKIINIFSIVVGAVSVIMIIIGGFRYIISGGDQNGVTGAKNTIMYAIIGLVIVLFAQVIVRFVLTNVKTTS